MLSSSLCELVEVDRDHILVLAVIDQGIFIDRLEVFVDLPEFGHGGVVCTCRALPLECHFDDLPLGSFHLGVTKR
ncbi:hypothetical protein D3C73_1561790 [compost metagenome]